MRSIHFLLRACMLVGLLLVAVVPASTSAQGNSDAAHMCQKGGYATLIGAGGETFANAGECTSFAARGGVFADGTILIPAGWSATISNQVLVACNTISFGFTLNGGNATLPGSKPYDCNGTYTYPDYVVGPVSETSVLVVYLEDESCRFTYDSNGNHARLVANPPVYEVDITDTGGYCEAGPDEDRYPAEGANGNLSLTVTVHQP